MWNFVMGALIGRRVRDASLPDSVKQQRYDARLARKRARYGPNRQPGEPVLGRGTARLVLVLVAACVVGLIVIAATR